MLLATQGAKANPEQYSLTRAFSASEHLFGFYLSALKRSKVLPKDLYYFYGTARYPLGHTLETEVATVTLVNPEFGESLPLTYPLIITGIDTVFVVQTVAVSSPEADRKLSVR